MPAACQDQAGAILENGPGTVRRPGHCCSVSLMQGDRVKSSEEVGGASGWKNYKVELHSPLTDFRKCYPCGAVESIRPFYRRKSNFAIHSRITLPLPLHILYYW